MTKSLAIQLAPYNIRVNVINPVATETPLLKTFFGVETDEQLEEARK
jgi:3-oxoacyl-[acyl-carrier protein] reductase